MFRMVKSNFNDYNQKYDLSLILVIYSDVYFQRQNIKEGYEIIDHPVLSSSEESSPSIKYSGFLPILRHMLYKTWLPMIEYSTIKGNK